MAGPDAQSAVRNEAYHLRADKFQKRAGGTLRVVCFGMAQSGCAEACAAIGIVEQRDYGVRHLMG